MLKESKEKVLMSNPSSIDDVMFSLLDLYNELEESRQLSPTIGEATSTIYPFIVRGYPGKFKTMVLSSNYTGMLDTLRSHEFDVSGNKQMISISEIFHYFNDVFGSIPSVVTTGKIMASASEAARRLGYRKGNIKSQKARYRYAKSADLPIIMVAYMGWRFDRETGNYDNPREWLLRREFRRYMPVNPEVLSELEGETFKLSTMMDLLAWCFSGWSPSSVTIQSCLLRDRGRKADTGCDRYGLEDLYSVLRMMMIRDRRYRQVLKRLPDAIADQVKIPSAIGSRIF